MTINLEEDEIQKRFEGKLDKVEEGDMTDVISKLFAVFARKKVTGIKVGGFNAEKDDKFKSIRCSMKAVEGQLYPLDKCFMFIASKPVLVEFDRVSSIEFNRVDKGARRPVSRAPPRNACHPLLSSPPPLPHP